MPDHATSGPSTPEWALPDWLERWARWVGRLLILIIGLVAGLWILSRLRVVLVPVLVGLLLAALSAPLASFLTRHKIPRLAAAWITLLLVVGLLVGTGYGVGVSVGNELTNGTEWDEVYSEILNWLETGPAGLTSDEIDDLERSVEESLIGGLQSMGVSRATAVVEVIGGMFLGLVLFFFFVKDGPEMWAWIVSRVRPRRRSTVDRGGRAAFGALQAYMRGVAVTGVVDALLIGLALYLIGVPLVVPLTILTFFAAFFPIVGATLAGALATLVALVTLGPQEAVFVAAATLVIQQVEGDVVMPLVMRRQVSLHPAVILVVLGIGGALAGIVGAFVAVPLAAMATAAAAAISDDRIASDEPRSGKAGEAATDSASTSDA
ncbi:MAG: AI-2E family transporter [Acidimicrobiales bacterium]|nr:AI-2E family transporter [Acidimicrobiales bacterium]